MLIYLLISLFVLALVLFSLYFLTLDSKRKRKAAELFEQEGKTDKALALYEEMAEKKPNQSDILYKLLLLYEAQKDYKKCTEVIPKLLFARKLPKNVTKTDLRKKLALYYQLIHNDEKAFQQYQILVKQDAQDHHSLFESAKIAMSQHDFAIATHFLKMAHEILPLEEDYLKLYTVSELLNKNYSIAKELNDKLGEIYSSKNQEADPMVFFTNGVIGYFSKNFLKANEALTAYLSVERDNIDREVVAGRMLAQLEAMIGSPERALQRLRALQERVKEKSADIYYDILSYDLSFLLLKQKAYEKSLQELESLEKAPIKHHSIHNLRELIKRQSLLNAEDDSSIFVTKYEKGLYINIDHAEPDNLPDYLSDWQDNFFATVSLEILFDIEKAGKKFDLYKYLYQPIGHEEAVDELNGKKKELPLCESLYNIPRDRFSQIARHVINNLGFEIDHEKYTENEEFMDGNGIDYSAWPSNEPQNKFFIQFRRWRSDSIGTLVFKGLEDKINNSHYKRGLFITTGSLSDEAIAFIERTSTINLIQNYQLENLLTDVMYQKRKLFTNAKQVVLT